jgi:phage tail sheath gpL-like
MSIPTSFRVPFMSVQIDPTKASQGPSILPYEALLIGSMRSTGSATASVLVRVTSVAQARTLFGAGSQLHLMVRAFFENNKVIPLYCIPLADHASGVAATKTLTYSGTATEDGTFYLYVGGKRIAVAVSSGDAATAVASAANAAFALIQDLPMGSGVSSAVQTLTALNDGVEGNDIDVRFNYNETEKFPSGISCAIATGTSGATNPDITSAITAMGDRWFQIICMAYQDTTNVGLLEDELEDRFGELRQIPGQAYIAINKTVGNAVTYGEARNSPHLRICDFYGIPWTTFEWASAWCAVESLSAQEDPALPLFNQRIRGLGALPPAHSAQRIITENDQLLHAGISTFKSEGGKLYIQRSITAYQTNAAGASDESYLEAETMFTLMFMRYDVVTQFKIAFPRAKLADDSIKLKATGKIVTPSVAKSKLIQIARGWEEKGLLENVEQFINNLSVSRNTSDRNRLDCTLSPDVVNQFVVGNFLLQFLK